MENSLKSSTTEVWTELFASAGLAGTLALCSGTFTGMETDQLKAINNFAVANGYVRRWMANYLVAMVKKGITRTSGGTD